MVLRPSQLTLSKLTWSQYHNLVVEQGWNQVGTELRTSRLTSSALFPDQECLKYGLKGPNSTPKRLKVSFGHTNQPRGPILGWKKGPTWCARMPPVVFNPCSTPSNPIKALWAELCGKRQFQHIGPLFGLGPWGHIWDILGLANCPNWSAWMSSVLLQHCSNLSRKKVWY